VRAHLHRSVGSSAVSERVDPSSLIGQASGRRAPVWLLAAVAILVAGALTLHHASGSQPGKRTLGRPHSVAAASASDEAQARAVAGRFLSGYLRYTCGRGSASEIRHAARRLIDSLEADPPRISPALAGRSPRVVNIVLRGPVAGAITASATIKDGAVIDYGLVLVIGRESGRLLVTGVREAA
jgi:hypothetical protein